jgi:hypothetical protein
LPKNAIDVAIEVKQTWRLHREMSDYDPSGCWRRTAEILFGYNRDPVGFPMRLANIFGMVHNIA